MHRDLTPDVRDAGRDSNDVRDLNADRKRSKLSADRFPERNPERTLTERQREALHDIGRFRTVAAEDLSNHRYRGHSAVMRDDLDSMLAQGMLQKRTALVAKGRQKLVVFVLTKTGQAAAERNRTDPAQMIYRGFVKPSEVAHDAAIYRMFHKEASNIVSKGGRICRVVLDYELKRQIYSPLAKLRSKIEKSGAKASSKDSARQRAEYDQRQAQVARENGLKVVDGKIPLPDLRIEYQTATGEMTKVDLELATHHYHGSHLQTKAEAGFKMYAADGSAGRGNAVLEQREITASILSL